MNFEEINLKLFLDELGISHSNKTLSDRIAIQKAVYIGQCAGINMGFNYEWYEYGPYSRDLTPVYYRFNRNYADNERDYESCSLKEKVKERILEFKDLLTPPEGFKSSNDKIQNKSAWMELIASILYFMNKYNNNEDEVRNKLLTTNKKDYCEFFDPAVQEIKKVDRLKIKYYPEN